MKQLYFACSWVLHPIDKYVLVHAIDTAISLGARLAVDTTVLQNEQRLACITFILCVPSEDTLNIYIQNAGIEMELTDWNPIELPTDFIKDDGTWWDKELGVYQEWKRVFHWVMQGAHQIGTSNDQLRGEMIDE